MPEVHAVVLLPVPHMNELDPHGLLQDGPFGSRPPVMEILSCGSEGHPRLFRAISAMSGDPCPECGRRRRWVEGRALILWSDGQADLAGCLRVAIAMKARADAEQAYSTWDAPEYLSDIVVWLTDLVNGNEDPQGDDPRPYGHLVTLDAQAGEIQGACRPITASCPDV